MTREEFARRITAMTDTLYRVSCGLLRSEADREDAVQETILRAWEKLPALRQERYFETWTIRILINECYRIGRRAGRVVSLEDYTPPDETRPPADRELRDAILALPADYRVAVVLHYVEGYGVGEISRLLDTPAGTVKSRLYRARKILKQTMEEAQVL